MQDKVQQLAATVGLKPEQVQAALSTVVQFIQSKVPAPIWQQLATKMPQIQGWVSQAVTMAAPVTQAAGGMAAGLTAKLGAAGGDVAGLMAELKKAGISPDKAMQLVPLVLEQIKASAGPELFQKILVSVPGLSGVAGQLGGAAGNLLGAASNLLGGLFRK